MSDQTETYGEGVHTQIKGNKLLISIDLSETIGLSGSKKNMMIASTQGNANVAFNNQLIRVGINVFRKPTPAELQAELKAAAALEATG